MKNSSRLSTKTSDSSITESNYVAMGLQKLAQWQTLVGQKLINSFPIQWRQFIVSQAEGIKLPFTLDTRSIALYRIILAIVLLMHLFYRSFDLVAFFTDQGVLPRSVVVDGLLSPHRWSIYLAGGSTTFVVIMFIAQALIALCLLVGYRTRATTVLAWIFWLSLTNRNLGIVSGADDLIVTLLFWSMFLPLGIRFSVDEVLKKPNNNNQQSTITNAATVVFVLQIICFYVFAHFAKTGPEWTPNYTAGVYATYLESISTGIGRLARPFITFLTLSTWGVYWYQLYGALLLLLPYKKGYLRLFLIWGFIFMHLVFALLMNIGVFSYICIAMVLILIPECLWNWLAQLGRVLSSHKKLTLYYDETCEVCNLGTSALCDVNTTRRPLSSNTEMLKLSKSLNAIIAIDEANRQFTGYEALVEIIKARPFGIIPAFVTNVPFIKLIGVYKYKILAQYRHRISKIINGLGLIPSSPKNTNTNFSVSSIISQIIVLCVFVGVFAQLLDNYNQFSKYIDMPERATNTLVSLGMSQRWDMFSPSPKKSWGWVVVEGTLENGQVVDVLKQTQGPADFVQPEHLFQDYYHRDAWRKYIDERVMYGDGRYAANYAKYLCRSWNEDVAYGSRLKTFKIYKMERTTKDDFSYTPVTKKVLWDQICV